MYRGALPNMCIPNNPPQRFRSQMRPPGRPETNRESLYHERLRQIKAGMPSHGLETRVYYEKEIYDEEENPRAIEVENTIRRFNYNNQLMDKLFSQDKQEQENEGKKAESVAELAAKLEERQKLEFDGLNELSKDLSKTEEKWRQISSEQIRQMNSAVTELLPLEKCAPKEPILDELLPVVLEGTQMESPTEEELSMTKLVTLTPKQPRFRVQQGLPEQPRFEVDRGIYGQNRYVDPQWGTRHPLARPRGQGMPYGQMRTPCVPRQGNEYGMMYRGPPSFPMPHQYNPGSVPQQMMHPQYGPPHGPHYYYQMRPQDCGVYQQSMMSSMPGMIPQPMMNSPSMNNPGMMSSMHSAGMMPQQPIMSSSLQNPGMMPMMNSPSMNNPGMMPQQPMMTSFMQNSGMMPMMNSPSMNNPCMMSSNPAMMSHQSVVSSSMQNSGMMSQKLMSHGMQNPGMIPQQMMPPVMYNQGMIPGQSMMNSPAMYNSGMIPQQSYLQQFDRSRQDLQELNESYPPS